jgi:isochorismate synthase
LAIATTTGLGSDADRGGLERLWDAIAAEAGADPASATDATGHLATSTVRSTGLAVVDERPDRAEWERTVGMFAGAVGRGRIDKVVLARRVGYRAPSDLDVIVALRHLAASAPESTTFAFVRDGTTLLGATPERLVQTRGRSFETVAIAGSAPRGSDPAEDARLARRLLASEKEREEHAVVVDALRAGLLPIVETLQVADSPTILPLRHVQHLMTPITGTLREDAGLLSLGGRLHPTPAVGGAPRKLALELIADQEAFDRGWYAGPIGWLGADGDGELMVALRCGLATGLDAVLFAGCGIVADSDPAREWEESRLKLRTMTTALGGLAVDDR